MVKLKVCKYGKLVVFVDSGGLSFGWVYFMEVESCVLHCSDVDLRNSIIFWV